MSGVELIKVRVKARTFSHPSKSTPYKRGDELNVAPALLATFMNELEAVSENAYSNDTGSSSRGYKHKSKR